MWLLYFTLVREAPGLLAINMQQGVRRMAETGNSWDWHIVYLQGQVDEFRSMEKKTKAILVRLSMAANVSDH